MALFHVKRIVRDSEGDVVPSVEVTVKEGGTETNATIYADAGGTGKANPFTSGTDGRYDFWVDEGVVVDLDFAKTGYTIASENDLQVPLVDGDVYALLAGRAGGQEVHGGAGTGEDLILQSNPSKDGLILFGDNSAFNQAAESLGVGTTSPAVEFEVVGRIDVTRASSPRIGLNDTSTGQNFLLLNTASSFRVFHSQAGTSPFQVNASAPNSMLVIQGTSGRINFGPGSPRWCGYTTSAADPTTTELPSSKDFCIHKNTSSGNVFLAFNDGGAVKKVQLT